MSWNSGLLIKRLKDSTSQDSNQNQFGINQNQNQNQFGTNQNQLGYNQVNQLDQTNRVEVEKFTSDFTLKKDELIIILLVILVLIIIYTLNILLKVGNLVVLLEYNLLNIAKCSSQSQQH
jgi:hypothetical protein